MPSPGQPFIEKNRPPRIKRFFGGLAVPRLLSSPLHGLLSKSIMLVHFTRGDSGKKVTLPVVRNEIDGQLYVLSGQSWTTSFSGGRDAEVTLEGRRIPARGTLIEDPDVVARVFHRRIEQLGYEKAQGTLSLRFNADRAPTLEELREASTRIPLTLVRLDLDRSATSR